MIKPKKLNKGDKVALVSLSSGMFGEETINKWLKIFIRRFFSQQFK